ncbi:MAG: hypothetical protein O3C28_20375 [Proteobacteria bacterium]|nr:hypothetical protein [Pseudomonadota bacterium]
MFKRTVLTTVIFAICATASADKLVNIHLQQLGRFETGVFDESAAEIVAYDRGSQQLFVINANEKSVDILDISDPSSPNLVSMIDVTTVIANVGGVNGVAVHNGLVAIAVENEIKQHNGWAAFYSTDGHYLTHLEAGALPDMITFTPNGKYVLVANEGEPSNDYTNDPEGSITVIDIRKGVLRARSRQVGFTRFNNHSPKGVRISGPNASVAQDLEPEYIAVSADSKTAWVTLQENNAMAILDIKRARVVCQNSANLHATLR